MKLKCCIQLDFSRNRYTKIKYLPTCCQVLCLNTRWSCCGWRSRLSGRSASVWTGTWRPTWPPSPTPWPPTWPTAPTAASPRAGPLKVGLYCHFERELTSENLKIFAIPWTLNEYYLFPAGGTSFPAFDPTSKVDLVFLCCFPCLFLIFSIVYVIAFYF